MIHLHVLSKNWTHLGTFHFEATRVKQAHERALMHANAGDYFEVSQSASPPVSFVNAYRDACQMYDGLNAIQAAQACRGATPVEGLPAFAQKKE